MPPDEWLISRICEEFGCTPLEAIEQPLGLALTIMEMRSYAAAKRLVDGSKDDSQLPDHPMIPLAKEFAGEALMARYRANAKAKKQQVGNGRNR